jgi:hypothetical protein
MDFPEPLSLFDYYTAELNWRFDWLIDRIWELIEEIEDIKEALEYDNDARPPAEFDPFRTVF